MVSGAGEKAFCAGGDVAALATSNQKGPEGQQKSTDYFGLEYQLDHLIATYSKPYVAVMDGITMGGGVGLSVHAPFRIATENTLFAMPETTIGFFPDVGGSFFLSRLDGEIGTYLALTSERLKGVQTLYSGIATHYIDSSVLSNLTNRLSELVFEDYASMDERLGLVNKTINEFSTGLPPIEQEPILLGGVTRKAIDRCFKYDTIEEIVEALKKDNKNREWANKTLKTLLSRSPTSLKVTLRQLRLGKKWGISEAFRREYAIAARFMRHPDFVEGVSARLISKPAQDPKWNPAKLGDVKKEDVNSFFTAADKELALFNDIDYTSYPHAKYALPSEADILSIKKDPAVFLKTWGGKEGLRAKMFDVLAEEKKNTIEKWSKGEQV
jgi:3-hydroxyisobutyryl-CoA hydrolase